MKFFITSGLDFIDSIPQLMTCKTLMARIMCMRICTKYQLAIFINMVILMLVENPTYKTQVVIEGASQFKNKIK